MKWLRLLGSLTMLAGASLTGRSLYLHGKASLASILIRIAWEESVKTGVEQRPWPWADTHPIGRLRIPRLGYDEIVLEGASGGTLAFGPARVWSGARPGARGNLVLAGHRTSWFLPLKDLALGDTIVMESRGARHGETRTRTYAVDALRVVAPRDVERLLPADDDVLTLVTCHPFGPWPLSPFRFVVRAVPVADAAAEAQANVAVARNFGARRCRVACS